MHEAKVHFTSVQKKAQLSFVATRGQTAPPENTA